MKNLKTATLILIICAGIFSACSDNQFSPVSGSQPSYLSNDDNVTQTPDFEKEIVLKPGESGEFTSKDFRFKTLSSLEVKNLSNYGNISCNEIGIFLSPSAEGSRGFNAVCLSHQETFVVENLNSSSYVKIQNQSDKVVDLKLTVK